MKTWRIAITLTLLTATAWLPGVEDIAAAAVHTDTSDAGATLTITGSARTDDLTVTCSGGYLKVNGDDPHDGPLNCTPLQSLHISMLAGNDQVDLTDLDAVATPVLTDIEVKLGDGNDGVTGSFLAERLLGNAGDDGFNPLPGNDIVLGGPGNDEVTDQASSSVMLSDTQLNSSSGSRQIGSIEGAALVMGGNPSTVSAGGFTGDIYVSTLSGNDTITTGDGNDTIDSGLGNDVISSNGGADTIIGGLGADTFTGGPGKDTAAWRAEPSLSLSADQASDGVYVDNFSGMEKALYEGDEDADAVNALAFPGPVTFKGSGGADSFYGGSAADTANGGGGEDYLAGRGGADYLNGGPGNDTCVGGTGQDTLASC